MHLTQTPAVVILDGCGGRRPALRLSGCNINSDHVQVVAGGFERSFGIMVRNKSGVIVKGCIALPAETIKDDQQTGMFLVEARPHEIYDRDVVARLTSRAESMAKHDPSEALSIAS